MPSQQSFPRAILASIGETVENASFAILNDARFLMKALGDNDRVRAIQAYRALTSSTLEEARGLVDDILNQ